jgi:hypothetical protein
MRKISPLLSILAISLVVLSCGENEDQPRLQFDWKDLTSPFNTLWDVQYCFNHFDLAPNMIDYLSGFIADDFVFYFDPDDIGDDVGGYTIPSYWTRDEFIRAVNNMFNQAYDITFDIPVLEQGEEAFGKPAEGDIAFSKSNVTIDFILMVSEDNGYLAHDICDFKFIRGSDGLWQLCELKDHAPYLMCTMPTSFGIILALFN